MLILGSTTNPKVLVIARFATCWLVKSSALCRRPRTRCGTHIPSGFWRETQIVGYSKLKDCVRLLFWSGQSFATPGLAKEGKFKAAEVRYTEADEVDTDMLRKWLSESREIQWDYKNIVKRKGILERLK
jgi:hypothetical protein